MINQNFVSHCFIAKTIVHVFHGFYQLLISDEYTWLKKVIYKGILSYLIEKKYKFLFECLKL